MATYCFVFLQSSLVNTLNLHSYVPLVALLLQQVLLQTLPHSRVLTNPASNNMQILLHTASNEQLSMGP